jgi:tripartite-type tricarboxylate transporter receptor subunit TctC
MIRAIVTVIVAAACLLAGHAPAQGDRLIRVIVAFPPGGPVDFVARTIAEPLGKELGARVVVDNKAGGNGTISAETVARSAADGATIWLSSVGAIAINPVLYDKLPYDVQRDFAPVSLVVNNDELFVVNANDPANTVPEFIANAKKRSGPTPIASTGIGSIPHLAMEQLADTSKANLLHVPYKGAAPAVTDVMGGQVAGFFGDIPGLIGHVRGGKLKALGIAAPKRHPALPDVPTFAEQGVGGVDSNNWYALFVPAKTPPDVVAALNRAIRNVVATPAVSEKLAASGAVPMASTPQELTLLLQQDTVKWGKLIRDKKIIAE